MNSLPSDATTAPSATDRARTAILAELQPLQEQAGLLRERLAHVESQQAPLEAALVALGGPSRSAAEAMAKAKKPYVKKADVEAACHALLVDNVSLTKDDLEGLAKAKLSSERGFNLSGFGLRFKECLASEGFAVSADGVVSLIGSGSPRVVPPAVDKTASGSLRG